MIQKGGGRDKHISGYSGHQVKEPGDARVRDIWLRQEYSGFVDLNRLGAVGLQEPGMVEYITKEIKKKAAQPVSMKLTPNVTDITEIAKAA